MQAADENSQATTPSKRLGKTVFGVPQLIGSGFTAHHFSAEMFDGDMDPLLLVDDFVMSEPTFAPHLHVGMSAVTAVFEDSVGDFLNRDTLGHNIALRAGDLYWLAAASGAAHEERSGVGARTHALQIFVDLPAHLKQEPARSLLVRAEDVPVLEAPGHRVRVLLGRSGETVGAEGTPEATAMLDGFLEPDGRFSHLLAARHQAWVYAVSGRLSLRCLEEAQALAAGSATTVAAGPEADLVLAAGEPAHFVLIAAKPVREPLVGHAEGRLGRIPS